MCVEGKRRERSDAPNDSSEGSVLSIRSTKDDDGCWADGWADGMEEPRIITESGV